MSVTTRVSWVMPCAAKNARARDRNAGSGRPSWYRRGSCGPASARCGDRPGRAQRLPVGVEVVQSGQAEPVQPAGDGRDRDHHTGLVQLEGDPSGRPLLRAELSDLLDDLRRGPGRPGRRGAGPVDEAILAVFAKSGEPLAQALTGHPGHVGDVRDRLVLTSADQPQPSFRGQRSITEDIGQVLPAGMKTSWLALLILPPRTCPSSRHAGDTNLMSRNT